MSADAATIAYYEANAPRYTLSFGQAPSRHLDTFLDRLEPGVPILELGCGGGRDSARIIERGFDLDATDAVPAMVRKANERFGVGARAMRFDELQAKEEYDAVWAHACLLHVARRDLPEVLGAIYCALKPGGLHFANYNCAMARAAACWDGCITSPIPSGSKAPIAAPVSNYSKPKSIVVKEPMEQCATGSL